MIGYKMDSFFPTRALALAFFLLNITVIPLQAQRDFGVDVSHFQGASGVSQSAWNQMYAEGKRFVFIKGSEGLTDADDAAMATNVVRATTAGLRAGVYHFAHPENRPTTNGAVQEADHFLDYAGTAIGPGYLRPALDLEASAGNITTTELTDWVIAFCDRIVAQRGSNSAPIIYCDQRFANVELDSRLVNYDLWLRTITSTVDPATGTPPSQGYTKPSGVFSNWSFWQYSATGSSGGITPLDLNVCHSEYKSLDSFLINNTNAAVPPIITLQPQNKLNSVGDCPRFVVSASGTPPFSYQWRFNGTNLSGATLNTCTLTNVQFSQSGNYSVVITNAGGSVTSVVAALVVITPTTLFQDNFDGFVSPSTITSAGTANGYKLFFGAASGSQDFTATFGFDYSTATRHLSIPSAPRSSGTTKGLFLTVNKDATGAAAAINLYPVSQSFTGNYALKFDVWMNWTNTATSTEHALFGLNHSGNITNRVRQATSDGLFFAMSGDGNVTPTSTTLRDYATHSATYPWN
jgi:GH25 family lysozyme M1 (1,4-beta-N-acetylmuramidase)